jgi:phosphoglycolate phosphatase
MTAAAAGLVVWDVDGTLIPADLRWLRRGIARAYGLAEGDVVFPDAKVHGYTDESIVVDAAISSGVEPKAAEAGVADFYETLAEVMADGRDELARDQPPYPGARDSMLALREAGFVQTVLTGNLRFAAEVKLEVAGLADLVDFAIGGYGSDARDRFDLPAVIEQRFQVVYGNPLDPRSTVVIGDAANDIACARHAGFHVVAVAHRVTQEELAKSEPDAVLGALAPSAVLAAVTALVGAA